MNLVDIIQELWEKEFSHSIPKKEFFRIAKSEFRYVSRNLSCERTFMFKGIGYIDFNNRQIRTRESENERLKLVMRKKRRVWHYFIDDYLI